MIVASVLRFRAFPAIKALRRRLTVIHIACDTLTCRVLCIRNGGRIWINDLNIRVPPEIRPEALQLVCGLL
jgi:hypothetical protein